MHIHSFIGWTNELLIDGRFSIVIPYFLFWHITLYHLNWSSRPFIANRTYKPSQVIHNMFWSCCGVVIWVCFELVCISLWANDRVAFLADSDLFSSWSNIFNLVLSTCLIPAWRDFHFYFAHRFLHFKPMYVHVHSLHHRNTDVEPFAGKDSEGSSPHPTPPHRMPPLHVWLVFHLLWFLCSSFPLIRSFHASHWTCVLLFMYFTQSYIVSLSICIAMEWSSYGVGTCCCT